MACEFPCVMSINFPREMPIPLFLKVGPDLVKSLMPLEGIAALGFFREFPKIRGSR